VKSYSVLIRGKFFPGLYRKLALRVGGGQFLAKHGGDNLGGSFPGRYCFRVKNNGGSFAKSDNLVPLACKEARPSMAERRDGISQTLVKGVIFFFSHVTHNYSYIFIWSAILSRKAIA
jgi:hypothetical protein